MRCYIRIVFSCQHAALLSGINYISNYEFSHSHSIRNADVQSMNIFKNPQRSGPSPCLPIYIPHHPKIYIFSSSESPSVFCNSSGFALPAGRRGAALRYKEKGRRRYNKSHRPSTQFDPPFLVISWIIINFLRKIAIFIGSGPKH